VELEEPEFTLEIRPDRRPTMPEPLPVRLIAVADVRLPCPPEKEVGEMLDAFYVGLLKFRRLPSDEFHHFYLSDNYALILQAHNRPVQRERVAPTMIEVEDRKTIHQQLIEREYPYEWMRDLTPGADYLLLQDPAGNWVGILQRTQVG
jgi:hypothetical protein